MNIIRKARGTKIPKQIQRILLCCNHSNTYAKDKLIEDLLSTDAGIDCVVSWLDKPDNNVDIEALYDELRETQALVLLVTAELCRSMDNGKKPVEFEIAQKLHIPIIPIIQEVKLFPQFTALVGAIHGIAITDSEYRIKLKAQLEIFLTSEEIIHQIQKEVFSSVIFLSYRKMDIHDARLFMKKFHDIEAFESISIWYDNFLTAGRNFDYEIEESIIKSNAFVLLVTPNLATEGNYVQTTEYPFAIKKDKLIIPVESTQTEHSLFAALFPGAGNVISMHDPSTLLSTFEPLLKNDFSDRKTTRWYYLLGLAYLRGYGVERDSERAIKLLEKAANKNDADALKAAKQLVSIYNYGIGTEFNYQKALAWQKNVVTLTKEVIGNNKCETMIELSELGQWYNKTGDSKLAQETLEEAVMVFTQRNQSLEEFYPSGDPLYAIANFGAVADHLANVYRKNGDFEKAEKINEMVKITYAYVNNFVPKDTISSRDVDRERAVTHHNAGLIHKQKGEHQQAIDEFLKALDIMEKCHEPDHTDIAVVCDNLGASYTSMGNHQEAMAMFEQAVSIGTKAWGSDHPEMAIIYSNISAMLFSKKDFLGALKFAEKSYDIFKKHLGDSHPNTLSALKNMKLSYEAAFNTTIPSSQKQADNETKENKKKWWFWKRDKD